MMAINTKISFVENMGTEVVSIYVGEERKRFVVHKNLLTSQSEYFDKALNGNFKEADENAIYFKEDDPIAVGYLVTWLYQGVIPGTSNGNSNRLSPFARLTPERVVQPSGSIPYPEAGSSLPFAYFRENEPNSFRDEVNIFVNIVHDRTYAQFSPEELRVADYDQGRKYGDGHPNLLPSPAAPPLPAYSQSTFSLSALGQQALPQHPAAIQTPTGSLTTTSSLFGTPTQQQTTQPASTGTPLFGSASLSGSIFGNRSSLTSTTQTLPALPAPFRPSRFGGIGGASSVFGGAPNASHPTFQPNPLAKKPELRPGDFGFSPTIVYPTSDGKFLDGIPRSGPVGVTQVDLDAHQDALLHLCVLAETILWPKLFNAAITAYTSGELNILRNIPVHHINTIYERTHSESKLREFAIDGLRRLINPVVACKDYMAIAQQHEEFLEALLLRISTMLATNTEDGSVFQMQEGILSKVYFMDVGSVGTNFCDNRSTRKDNEESHENEL